MVSRLTGAVVRAVLVMLMVAMPSLLLTQASADTKQMVALVSLFVGALTLVEYAASYPSLVEFRHAPPFNRIRFVMLSLIVLGLSLMVSGPQNGTTAGRLAEALGGKLAAWTDSAYHPLRALVAGARDLSLDEQAQLRGAVTWSFTVALVMVGLFYALLRRGAWPARGSSFNVWVNLPVFDPTAGSDIVERLERDGRFNLLLALAMPILLPLLASYGLEGLTLWMFEEPQVLIWAVALWAFLPATLVMRSIAMWRVAGMIREQRRGALASEPQSLSSAVSRPA